MNKDYDILMKQNKLHKHEIKKIQGLATKNGWEKGLHEGEL